ncbi:spore coat putative kinase YutH [Salibacterium aidingense]|uniref:spore coat putative kinase YutH n=1 Tax=Salibacterium aidingense TaxID=384933 RepID=UPI003BBB8AA3
MERSVYDHYGLYMTESFQAGRYTGFSTRDGMYVFVPEKTAASSWEEKTAWADWMRNNGDGTVAAFISPLSGGTSMMVDGEKQRLFRLYSTERKQTELLHPGAELGTFHEKAKSLFQPYPAPFFLDRWAQWWEIRLNQLESWYEKVRQKSRCSPADQWFIQTFPYYMGKTENAIQRLHHIREEEQTEESGCITHLCFTPETWIIAAPHSVPNKLPADWLHDHPARDVAEWIRYAIDTEAPFQETKAFLSAYEEHSRLSSVSWKLVAARLIFPYYYMEQMERIYLHETTRDMETVLSELKATWEKEAGWMDQLHLLQQAFPAGFEDYPGWMLGKSDSLA